MANYQKLYAILCGAASEAIDLIEDGETEKAAGMLKKALLECEELYVSAEEQADT